jgi:GABA(A) receptor-associated protein
MWKFKNEHTFEERKGEADKIFRFWPDKIPMVLEKWSGSRLEVAPKAKLLCPKTYSYTQFLSCLRAKLKLTQFTALFVFVNGSKLISGDELVASIYQKEKDEDGFLYLMYCEHETLGSQ